MTLQQPFYLLLDAVDVRCLELICLVVDALDDDNVLRTQPVLQPASCLD